MQTRQIQENKLVFRILSHKEIIFLVFVLMTGYILYQPSLHSGWMYDDQPNLQGLSLINDLETALAFVFSEKAGPTGRPIAFASFLPTLSDWPHNPYPFKLINLWIHLLNGALLCIWLKLVCNKLSLQDNQKTAIVIFCSAIWLLHPFLATPQLSIIQRMTSLSASFMLMGFIAYSLARNHFEYQPKRSLVLMSLAVGLSTTLALLTKENGVLLPLYLLIYEQTLLKNYASIENKLFCNWKKIFLILPNIIILLYIARSWPDILKLYEHRTFSLGERLLTENIVLIDYIKQLLLPKVSSLGPFHDHYPVSKSLFEPIETLISLLFWLFVFSIALILRKKQPVLLFCFSWYVGGHLLESSVYPLELYFEHRNYLPSISIFFCLSYLIFQYQGQLKKFIFASYLSYLILLAFNLSEISKLWSNPLVAAQIWVKNFPDSERAHQYLLMLYTNVKDLKNADLTVKNAMQRIPESGPLALQSIYINCLLGQYSTDEIDNLINNRPELNWTVHIITSLKEMNRLQRNNECAGLERKSLYALVNYLLNHETVSKNSIRMANLHIFMAEMFREDLNLNGSMTHLDLANSFYPHTKTYLFAVNNLQSAGLYQNAQTYLNKARKHLPFNPFHKRMLNREIEKFQRLIEQQRKLKNNQS